MCATKVVMAKLIAIRGSKDGLRLQLDEQAAWEEVLDALRAQISQGASFFNGAQLVVDVGERALGDRKAVICALELAPTQLRIADLIARAPEGGAGRFPEVAFVENDQIGVEPWETYRK